MYAAEVEGVLMSHALVRHAAVVAVPDARLGQTVAAAVVVRACRTGGREGVGERGADEHERECTAQEKQKICEDLQRHCRDVLSPFKVPSPLPHPLCVTPFLVVDWLFV